MTTVQQRVNEALANSQANGFEPEKQTAEELAADLTTYDADLENCPIGVVQAAAQNWLDEQE